MSCATSVFSVMFMSFISYATYHIMINITNFLTPFSLPIVSTCLFHGNNGLGMPSKKNGFKDCSCRRADDKDRIRLILESIDEVASRIVT